MSKRTQYRSPSPLTKAAEGRYEEEQKIVFSREEVERMALVVRQAALWQA